MQQSVWTWLAVTVQGQEDLELQGLHVVNLQPFDWIKHASVRCVFTLHSSE